jgi:nucleoside-diphosphate-sugar epimerase
MIFILGGNGFVGSAFARLCARQGREHVVITRENYDSLRGKACKIFVNANGNSRKRLPVEQPLADFDQSVRSVRASLVDFAYDRYVFLSSCDVYPDCSTPERTGEDSALDLSCVSPYGFHKLLAEQCVRHVSPRHLIFRMGGFVGPGMKKNAIFDILGGGPLWLDPESELQFLPTDRLALAVLDLAERVQNETFNICGRGTIALGEVIALVGRPVPVVAGAPRVRYEIQLSKILQAIELPESRSAVLEFVRQQRGAFPAGVAA